MLWLGHRLGVCTPYRLFRNQLARVLCQATFYNVHFCCGVTSDSSALMAALAPQSRCVFTG